MSLPPSDSNTRHVSPTNSIPQPELQSAQKKKTESVSWGNWLVSMVLKPARWIASWFGSPVKHTPIQERTAAVVDVERQIQPENKRKRRNNHSQAFTQKELNRQRRRARKKQKATEQHQQAIRIKQAEVAKAAAASTQASPPEVQVEQPASPMTRPQANETKALDGLFNHLKNKRDTQGNPLFKNRAEFNVIMPSLPQLPRDTVLSGLKNFRQLQRYQNLAGVQFDNAMFMLLLEHNHLASDVTVVEESLMAYADDFRKAAIEDVHRKAKELQDLEPDRTKANDVLEAGYSMPYSGMHNWGSMCFMNSSLQVMAHSLVSTGKLEKIVGSPMPHASVMDMVGSSVPDVDYKQTPIPSGWTKDDWHGHLMAERNVKVADKAREVLTAYTEGKSGQFDEQFEAYGQMRDNFVALCRALSEPPMKGQPVIFKLQKQFMQSYQRFAVATGRYTAQRILGDNPATFKPTQIVQEDPQEFINDVYQVFGLNVDHQYTMKPVSRLRIKKDTKQLFARKARVNPPIPIHMLEVKVKDGKPVTLQNCMQAYISEEELGPKERIKWTPAELEAAGYPQYADLKPDAEIWQTLRAEFQDTMQLGFQAGEQQAPDRITLQMKIFAHEGEGKQAKLEKEGKELAKACREGVTIPVYPHQIPPDQTIRSLEPQQVRYRVSGMVCHSGTGASSGHYVAIKFDGDRTVICDDSVVLEMNDYIKFNGLKSKNLEELVEEKGWSGYLFSLEKLNAPFIHST